MVQRLHNGAFLLFLRLLLSYAIKSKRKQFTHFLYTVKFYWQ